MGTKSKLFRVFVEGNTISDGREITAEMIDQCVETFDAKTYTPRINVEHISGFSPEPPFNGYGDVIAVEARDDKFTIAGKEETRRALYAQVDGNDQLVALAKRDQKPFPSVELTPSYAGVGKVGLIGLAFTDTPASIGTQRLQFSRSAPGSLFATSPDAQTPEFEAKPGDASGVAESVKTGVLAAFSSLFKSTDKKDEPAREAPPKAANDNFDVAAFSAAMGNAVAAAIKPIAEAQEKTQADFAALKEQLEKTEQPGFSRGPATGASIDAQFATDC